jgi:raffinose/stachyose/melibiose transport system substrate-binding protein
MNTRYEPYRTGSRLRRLGLRLGVVAVVGSLAAGLTACSPAEESPSGTVNFTVLSSADGDKPKVDAYKKVEALFNKTHPGLHVTIKNQSFAQMQQTGMLQASSKDAPSLLQVNQGWQSLGQLVRAGVLSPVDDYAKKYGWDKLQSKELIDINGRQDKTSMAHGSLWGMATDGNFLGLYTNHDLLKKVAGTDEVPTTLAEFESLLAKAKAAGITPLALSAGQGSQNIIHLLYLVLLSEFRDSSTLRSLINGTDKHSWSDPQVDSGAKKFQEWAAAGYFGTNYASLTDSARWDEFTTGKSLFTIDGGWSVFQVDSLKSATFDPFPTATSSHGREAILTGNGPWVLPAKSPHPKEAMEFLDFILRSDVAEILLQHDQIPCLNFTPKTKLSGAMAQAYAGWKELSGSGSPYPYLDWTAPSFYDTFVAKSMDLATGRVAPDGLGKALQGQYESFRGTLK